MPELHMPDGFLQGLSVERCLGSKNGVSSFVLRSAAGHALVLKHISIPESPEKLEALLLSGAYPDRAAANEYYRLIAEDLLEEVRRYQALSDCPNVLLFGRSNKLVPKEDGVGYDLYVTTEYGRTLAAYRDEKALTHLEALNLGLDISAALEAMHDAGFVFQNLRPENIFLTDSGRFLLGDFGLASMQDMQYSSLPEQYLSEYSAPELGGVLSGLNQTIDIYSLGMVLYRIYNGNHAPFEDESTGVEASEERRRKGEALPAPLYADYELAEILSKACAFRPEDRYATPKELHQALADYMRRNEVSDKLIVPPIIASPEPLTEDSLEPPDEPLRITDVNTLDEEFIAHFRPDTAGLEAVIAAVRKEEARSAGKEAAQQPEAAAETLTDAAPEAPADAEAKIEAAQADAGSADAGEAAQQAQSSDAQTSALPEEPVLSDEELAEFIDDEDAERDTEYADADEEPAAPTLVRKSRKELRQEHAAKKKEATPRKRHPILIALGVLLALLITAALLYGLTDLGHDLYEYEITVSELTVTKVTADSVSLHVASNDTKGLLVLHCTDAYGNTREQTVTGDAPIVFEGLGSGVPYSFRITLEGFHKLSGVTECAATTLPTTEILTFAAALAPEETAAQLTLVVKDGCAEPEEWLLEISAAGEQTRTKTFASHSVIVTGLSVGTEYTFRLLDTELCCLTGQTELHYTPIRQILADGLAIESILDGVVTVRWSCLRELPEEWVVTCEAPDGVVQNAQEVQIFQEEDGTYKLSASFENVQVGEEYLFRVSAEGMYQGLTYVMPSEIAYVSSFTAEVEEKAIVLTWTSAYTPEGGWVLSIIPHGSDYYATGVTMTENTYRLEYQNDSEAACLLPDTAFDFALLAGNGEPLFGHTEVSAVSQPVPEFDRLGLDVTKLVTGLYLTPTNEDWDYRDLLKSKPQEVFHADESIELLLRNRAGVTRSDSPTNILIVVRDSEGQIVDYFQSQKTWSDMWDSRYFVAHLSRTPQEPGDYTVELYFSYEHVKTFELTIE